MCRFLPPAPVKTQKWGLYLVAHKLIETDLWLNAFRDLLLVNQ